MKNLHQGHENVRQNGVIGLGLRPEQGPDTINIKVSFGNNEYEVTVPSNSSFGDLKSVIGQKTGLKLESHKLLFRGKDKEDDESLQAAGVKENSKVLLVEDATNKQNTHEEVKETCVPSKGGEAVAKVKEQVDKLAEQVSAIQVVVDGGTKVDEKNIIFLTEMLMRQLLNLDGIDAEGDGKVQRKMEVRRVQGLVDTMDLLKSKNKNPTSMDNTASVTTQWQSFELASETSTAPSPEPSSAPSHAPSSTHSHVSSSTSSHAPSVPPSHAPAPSAPPSHVPSAAPHSPSAAPSQAASSAPTHVPSSASVSSTTSYSVPYSTGSTVPSSASPSHTSFTPSSMPSYTPSPMLSSPNPPYAPSYAPSPYDAHSFYPPNVHHSPSSYASPYDTPSSYPPHPYDASYASAYYAPTPYPPVPYASTPYSNAPYAPNPYPPAQDPPPHMSPYETSSMPSFNPSNMQSSTPSHAPSPLQPSTKVTQEWERFE